MVRGVEVDSMGRIERGLDNELSPTLPDAMGDVPLNKRNEGR